MPHYPSSIQDIEESVRLQQKLWSTHRMCLEEQSTENIEQYIDEVLVPFFHESLLLMAHIKDLQPNPAEWKTFFDVKGRAHELMGEVAEAVGEVSTAAEYFTSASECLHSAKDQLRTILCALQTQLEILMDEESDDITHSLACLDRGMDILEMGSPEETDTLLSLFMRELHGMSLFFCEIISHHSDCLDMLMLTENTELPLSPLEDVLGTILREKDMPEMLSYFFEALLAAMQGNTDIYHSMLHKTQKALAQEERPETLATLEEMMRAW